MNPEYHIYQEIDRYLRDEMSAKESQSFAQRIAEEPDLAATFEAQKAAHNAIVYQELSQLKHQLKATEKKIQFRQKIKYYSIAGIALCIFVVVGYAWMTSLEEQKKSQTIQSPGVLPRKDSDKTLQLPIKEKFEEQHIAASDSGQSEKTIQEAPIHLNQKETAASTQVKKEANNNDAAKIDSSDTLGHQHDTVSIDTSSRVVTIPDSLPDPQNSAHKTTSCDLPEPDINTQKSCIHKPTGSVELVFDDNTLEFSDNNIIWKKNNTFYELPDGEHTFYYRKSEVCGDSVTVQVKTKHCTPEDITISPYHGEKWKIPVHDDENATLTILSGKGGSIVYEKEIINGSPSYWDGTNQTGTPLSQGTYVYIVKFDSGEVIKGRIGILTH